MVCLPVGVRCPSRTAQWLVDRVEGEARRSGRACATRSASHGFGALVDAELRAGKPSCHIVANISALGTMKNSSIWGLFERCRVR